MAHPESRVHCGVDGLGRTRAIAVDPQGRQLMAVTPGLGVTDGSDAGAGYIGETVGATKTLASGLSLSTGVATNVLSILLNPGDWDVRGNVFFQYTSSPANSESQASATISTTSATIADDGHQGYANIINPTGGVSTVLDAVSLSVRRLSLGVTTTVYLVASVTFSSGTMKAGGFIEARRVR